ncbi:hypothetical protein TPHA_0M00800 [Tetrapisispora phaffii CBS 4417]|uniref:Uncharacterized protein n=1 Tax=Tetrapisispora phaffii (strain ATCC 24235 / CBS 4417 / NBRC 1672 / NRRL Y-8282 / UCD 70-5) TaxID=1071381 RepID=G8C0E0_TETPH|nr:hypothetical protein TPHA_0M00800 [Tetrapisispora phaffii CBS 4417]CCE65655.1 hypothetical protein TPHA_0M00800 [Tetrapisispora phaffii CBS 4417]
MDEKSSSRVLENMDSNSMSLLYSSPSINSHSNSTGEIAKNSFFKITHSPTFENDKNTPLKWQQEKQEFQFQSNSTPSKSNFKNPQQRLLQARKRRSTLMGAKPRVPSRLNKATSKLDLIDDRTLTSLPIPHPQKNENNNLFQNRQLNNKRPRYNETKELRVHNDQVNRNVSYNQSTLDDSLDSMGEDKENTSKNYDHPIVLLEDYISYDDSGSSSRKRNKRRISLSDLKRKMHKGQTNNVLKLRKIKHPSHLSNLTFSLAPNHANASSIMTDISEQYNTFEPEPNENSNASSDEINGVLKELIHPVTGVTEDQYISRISKKSQLVSCVVCDKVLYELSSILPENNKFKEIVCGNCAEKYEAAAKLFEDYEFDSSLDISNSSIMSGMNNNVQYLENIGLIKHKNTDTFSNELITRLQSQLKQTNEKDEKQNNEEFLLDSKSVLWFIEARKKIRWRWRISKLLPEFLSNHNSNTTQSS